ncbi:hypothetical protein OW763_02815 [Clostridium aestuarii]|uniref:Lipoprotein n=1 Tax=Clostridium aestuarii TaxID=338193 RepID=A0ABT4CWB0_9CLOT|nr:hypothetical protein [Clostridium aestuarii]MCY6483287.1 hypothetical protein [Clostridium aestuarii]
MIKKFFSIILIMLFTILLISCGNNNNNQATDSIQTQYDAIKKQKDNSSTNSSEIPPENEELKKAITTLVKSCLKIQYTEKNTTDLKKICTQNFIKNKDNFFYKINSNPYEIIKISKIINEDKENKTFSISVELKDTMGKYKQTFHIFKKENSYYIDSIIYEE